MLKLSVKHVDKDSAKNYSKGLNCIMSFGDTMALISLIEPVSGDYDIRHNKHAMSKHDKVHIANNN